MARLLGWVGDYEDWLVADGYDMPPGSGEYGHISIAISGTFPPGWDWTAASKLWTDANFIRAAGIMIDDIGAGLIEVVDAKYLVESLYFSGAEFHIPEEIYDDYDDECDRYHRVDITFVDSLNVVAP